MSKPTIIYVSGAPGSGKTTLAKLLSEQLYIPHVSSDLVHGGVFYTQGGNDRHKTLHEVFVPLMIDMADRGVSFVVDHVLQKGLSEKSIVDKLRPHANIVYVHTQASNPIERYTARVEQSTIPNVALRREHLLSIAEKHRDNLPRTTEPLDLGIEAIVVNTDDGYAPDLQTIIQRIKGAYTN